MTTRNTGTHHKVRGIGLSKAGNKYVNIEEKSLTTFTFPRKKNEFTQETRRAAERNRKLRDRYHRSPRDKNTWVRSKALRLKYLTRSKHKRPRFIHKIIAARKEINAQGSQYHVGGKFYTERSHQPSVTKAKTRTSAVSPECYMNETCLAMSDPANEIRREHPTRIYYDQKSQRVKRVSPGAEENPEGAVVQLFRDASGQHVMLSGEAMGSIPVKEDCEVYNKHGSSGPEGRDANNIVKEEIKARSTFSKRDTVQLPDNSRYLERYPAEGGRCRDYGPLTSRASVELPGSDQVQEMWRDQVHVAETVITVIVKDVNDNAPVFPNATIYGEVQENGPIGKYSYLQLCMSMTLKLIDIAQ